MPRSVIYSLLRSVCGSGISQETAHPKTLKRGNSHSNLQHTERDSGEGEGGRNREREKEKSSKRRRVGAPGGNGRTREVEIRWRDVDGDYENVRVLACLPQQERRKMRGKDTVSDGRRRESWEVKSKDEVIQARQRGARK